MRTILIDGALYHSAREIHALFAQEFEWPFYGHNLDALWDFFTTEIERPFFVYWINADLSIQRFESDYRSIVSVLKKVEQRDEIQCSPNDRFHFIIEP